MNRLSKSYKRAVDQKWGRMANFGLLAQNIQNCTLLSQAANLSRIGQCFQYGKGVSLVPRYEDTKTFTPSPQKIDFWPKNGQIWPKTDIFGQIWAFLAHLIQCPTKKQLEQDA